MFHRIFRLSVVLVVGLLALGALSGTAAAAEEACTSGCLEDPNQGPPKTVLSPGGPDDIAVIPGDNVQIDMKDSDFSAVDSISVMPGDNVSIQGDMDLA